MLTYVSLSFTQASLRYANQVGSAGRVAMMHAESDVHSCVSPSPSYTQACMRYANQVGSAGHVAMMHTEMSDAHLHFP